VEACGICHTDAATVTGIYPGLTLPRVPGHEVVGRIDSLGSGVSRWKIGQRVGVGFFGGEDGVCEPCRRGDIVNCQKAIIGGMRKFAPQHYVLSLLEINGEPGFVSYVNGQSASALVLEAADDHIQAIYVITNPAKLVHLPSAPS
jgi:D-arabinose 1-dehydrogenase-like Zn-dependent alcohol dehydrogenase